MTKTRKNMDTVNWLTHRASSDLLRSCQCPFPSPVSYSGRHAAFRSRFLRPLCLSRDLSPPRSFSLTLLKYTYWSVIFLESPSICVCLVFYHAQLDGNYIFLAKKKKNPTSQGTGEGRRLSLSISSLFFPLDFLHSPAGRQQYATSDSISTTTSGILWPQISKKKNQK